MSLSGYLVVDPPSGSSSVAAQSDDDETVVLLSPSKAYAARGGSPIGRQGTHEAMEEVPPDDTASVCLDHDSARADTILQGDFPWTVDQALAVGPQAVTPAPQLQPAPAATLVSTPPSVPAPASAPPPAPRLVPVKWSRGVNSAATATAATGDAAEPATSSAAASGVCGSSLTTPSHAAETDAPGPPGPAPAAATASSSSSSSRCAAGDTRRRSGSTVAAAAAEAEAAGADGGGAEGTDGSEAGDDEGSVLLGVLSGLDQQTLQSIPPALVSLLQQLEEERDELAGRLLESDAELSALRASYHQLSQSHASSQTWLNQLLAQQLDMHERRQRRRRAARGPHYQQQQQQQQRQPGDEEVTGDVDLTEEVDPMEPEGEREGATEAEEQRVLAAAGPAGALCAVPGAVGSGADPAPSRGGAAAGREATAGASRSGGIAAPIAGVGGGSGSRADGGGGATVRGLQSSGAGAEQSGGGQLGPGVAPAAAIASEDGTDAGDSATAGIGVVGPQPPGAGAAVRKAEATPHSASAGRGSTCEERSPAEAAAEAVEAAAAARAEPEAGPGAGKGVGAGAPGLPSQPSNPTATAADAVVAGVGDCLCEPHARADGGALEPAPEVSYGARVPSPGLGLPPIERAGAGAGGQRGDAEGSEFGYHGSQEWAEPRGAGPEGGAEEGREAAPSAAVDATTAQVDSERLMGPERERQQRRPHQERDRGEQEEEQEEQGEAAAREEGQRQDRRVADSWGPTRSASGGAVTRGTAGAGSPVSGGQQPQTRHQPAWKAQPGGPRAAAWCLGALQLKGRGGGGRVTVLALVAIVAALVLLLLGLGCCRFLVTDGSGGAGRMGPSGPLGRVRPQPPPPPPRPSSSPSHSPSLPASSAASSSLVTAAPASVLPPRVAAGDRLDFGELGRSSSTQPAAAGTVWRAAAASDGENADADGGLSLTAEYVVLTLADATGAADAGVVLAGGAAVGVSAPSANASTASIVIATVTDATIATSGAVGAAAVSSSQPAAAAAATAPAAATTTAAAAAGGAAGALGLIVSGASAEQQQPACAALRRLAEAMCCTTEDVVAGGGGGNSRRSRSRGGAARRSSGGAGSSQVDALCLEAIEATAAAAAAAAAGGGGASRATAATSELEPRGLVIRGTMEDLKQRWRQLSQDWVRAGEDADDVAQVAVASWVQSQWLPALQPLVAPVVADDELPESVMSAHKAVVLASRLCSETGYDLANLTSPLLTRLGASLADMAAVTAVHVDPAYRGGAAAAQAGLEGAARCLATLAERAEAAEEAEAAAAECRRRCSPRARLAAALLSLGVPQELVDQSLDLDFDLNLDLAWIRAAAATAADRELLEAANLFDPGAWLTRTRHLRHWLEAALSLDATQAGQAWQPLMRAVGGVAAAAGQAAGATAEAAARAAAGAVAATAEAVAGAAAMARRDWERLSQRIAEDVRRLRTGAAAAAAAAATVGGGGGGATAAVGEVLLTAIRNAYQRQVDALRCSCARADAGVGAATAVTGGAAAAKATATAGKVGGGGAAAAAAARSAAAASEGGGGNGTVALGAVCNERFEALLRQVKAAVAAAAEIDYEDGRVGDGDGDGVRRGRRRERQGDGDCQRRGTCRSSSHSSRNTKSDGRTRGKGGEGRQARGGSGSMGPGGASGLRGLADAVRKFRTEVSELAAAAGRVRERCQGAVDGLVSYRRQQQQQAQ